MKKFLVALSLAAVAATPALARTSHVPGRQAAAAYNSAYAAENAVGYTQPGDAGVVYAVPRSTDPDPIARFHMGVDSAE